MITAGGIDTFFLKKENYQAQQSNPLNVSGSKHKKDRVCGQGHFPGLE